MGAKHNSESIQNAFIIPELVKNHEKHHRPDRCLPEKLIALRGGKGVRILNAMSQKYCSAMHYMKPNSDVLDLCAGSGFGSTMMARSGHNVTALDRSPDSLRVRGINTIEANFLKNSDVHLLPKAGSFDCVTFIDAIEHMDESYQKKALSLINKWLRPGGFLAVDTTIEHHPGDRTNSKHIWTHTWDSFGEIVGGQFTIERRFRIDFVSETIVVMTEDHSGLHTGVADQFIIARKK